MSHDKSKFPAILAQFKEWVGQQPHDRTYNFPTICGCAAGLYIQAIGMGKAITPEPEHPTYQRFERFTSEMDAIFLATHGWGGYTTIRGKGPEDWTFGKLHNRLKEHHPDYA